VSPSVRAGTRLHGSGRLLTGFLVIPVILGAEAIGDALVGGVGLPVNAVRVDLQQDRDAVPGAAGLCVPRIPSTALTSRVVPPAVRP
jgi:hypothetical protein